MKYLLCLFAILVVSSKGYSQNPDLLSLTEVINAGAKAYAYSDAYAKEGAEEDDDIVDDESEQANLAIAGSGALAETSGKVTAVSDTTASGNKSQSTATKKIYEAKVVFDIDCDTNNKHPAEAGAESKGVGKASAIYRIENNQGQYDWMKGSFVLDCTYTSDEGSGNPDMGGTIKMSVGPNSISATYDKEDDWWEVDYELFDEDGDVVVLTFGGQPLPEGFQVEGHELALSIPFLTRVDSQSAQDLIGASAEVEKWKTPPPTTSAYLKAVADSEPSTGTPKIKEGIEWSGSFWFEVFDFNPEEV